MHPPTGSDTEPAPQWVPLTESEIWFGYRGRLGVGQYWGRLLTALAGTFLVSYLLYGAATTRSHINTIDGLLALVTVFSIWPGTALAWKRLHDTGLSGLYFLLALFPILGPIFWVVLSLRQSMPAPNEFGPRPGYRY